MKATREQVFEAIISERNYQDVRWGDSASSGEPGNGERTLDEYALYIAGYTDQLVAVASTTSNVRAKLDAVRKVAALCVACMEQHGAPERQP